jgi:3'-5' exonuclease
MQVKLFLQSNFIIFTFKRVVTSFTFKGKRQVHHRLFSTELLSSTLNATTESTKVILTSMDSKREIDILISMIHNVQEYFPSALLNEASTSLYQLFPESTIGSTEIVPPSLLRKERAIHDHNTFDYTLLAYRAFAAGTDICQTNAIISQKSSSRKARWQRFQDAGARLHSVTSGPSDALCIAAVFGCLAVMDNNASRAAASALSLSVQGNKLLQEIGYDIANKFLQVMLYQASTSSVFNLHIIVQFAKAFNLEDKTGSLRDLSAAVIRNALDLKQQHKSPVTKKVLVNGALALACQIHPWPTLSPTLLVHASIPYDFWMYAEEVCLLTFQSARSPLFLTERSDAVLLEAEAIAAVELLIDTAMEAKAYRKADHFATSLYEIGGKSRYVDARLFHACDTISKVILKGKFSIIDRQVDRVDRAVAKVGEESTACTTVRDFTLQQLEEASQVEMALRFAAMWNIAYHRDEEFILAAAAARRQKYLQWDETVSGPIPELLSSPESLRHAFQQFRGIENTCRGPYGFDAEWDEDSEGVSLLQIAKLDKVLLIDVPALFATSDGIAALKETVGFLFADSKATLIGFSCSQDLSRLKQVHSDPSTQWIYSTEAVVDLQRIVESANPSLKSLGLSRVCEATFGKALDKTEQCSQWSKRPLFEKQRIYAAMDAWACVALYDRFSPT